MQREMLQRRTQAIVGEVEILEIDVAPGPAEIDAVRLVEHRCLRVEHAEEIGKHRHLEEDALTKPDAWSMRLISMAAKPMKLTICPTVASPLV